MTMESPAPFPDSPMDQDDVVYPCKGCGEILEEGKAFELAGNRWHIDCFRCNTCQTLLDSDANLLLLGDGSLICNNCTYSCSACKNKIEDLAILTGDQAFCSGCFRCRNCKRKIENLRYARTSQGIFCMTCHESLMARRRKKSRTARQNTNNSNGGTPPVLDKSLPALPPTEDRRFTPDAETPPYTDTPSELSPRPSKHVPKREAQSAANKTEGAPAHLDDNRRENQSLTLPASTYKSNRHSRVMQGSDVAGGEDGFFVPLALDPNPAPGPSPLAKSRTFDDDLADANRGKRSDGKEKSKDYFNRTPGTSSHRDVLKESTASSRSTSTERERTPASPHIAYQEKGRQPSIKQHSQASSYTSSPSTAQNDFKLQDAPKSRKNGSRRGSKHEAQSLMTRSPSDVNSRGRTPQTEQSSFTPSMTASPTSSDSPQSPFLDAYSRKEVELPKRGDSLNAPPMKQSMSRKEVGSGPTTPTISGPVQHERQESTSSAVTNHSLSIGSHINGNRSLGKPGESPGRPHADAPNAPPRSANRPAPPSTKVSPGDSFTAPRAAPPVPATERHKASESVSTTHSEHTMSPLLPRYSTGGEFSVDEEMARIMRGDESHEKDSSVLRRVSNAVKHGRSFSDRGTRAASSPKWKTSLNGAPMEISSPTSSTAADKEDMATLRNQLRHAQRRISELEVEKTSLQEMINSSADIKRANDELQDKRSTMAFLDGQRETLIRELEVMTDHLRRAKEGGRPFELESVKSEILRDFATSMEKLKEKVTRDIEGLIEKRQKLNDEIDMLVQMKDKGNMEYESLSQRNAELNQLNNEMISKIQDLYKTHREPHGSSFDGGRPAANGLGIYHAKEKSELPLELHNIKGEHGSYSNLLNEAESEPVVAAPHVVNIRKGKPNMWKKGSQAVAKNIKGIKGAFASNQYPDRSGSGGAYVTEGIPYSSMSSHSEVSTPTSGPKTGGDPSRRGFGGWLGDSQKNGTKASHLRSLTNNSSNPNLLNNGQREGGLFGVDLTVRCQFEKRLVPSIVSRCIQEVELRGADVEGIYRKSGGSGQVNQVRDGFEVNNDYDVSDPDLDIHAVTSALKQYFRRLPTPLITFDVYDSLLTAGQISDSEKRAVSMRSAINELPRCHRDCLEFLVFHLARVMAHASENLMTPLNLAVVFAPTIMRPQSIEREMTDMQLQRIAVQSLLELNQTVFAEP